MAAFFVSFDIIDVERKKNITGKQTHFPLRDHECLNLEKWELKHWPWSALVEMGIV